jgi:hypothetical protein
MRIRREGAALRVWLVGIVLLIIANNEYEVVMKHGQAKNSAILRSTNRAGSCWPRLNFTFVISLNKT